MAPNKMKGISFIKRKQWICLDFKSGYQGPKPTQDSYIRFLMDDLKLSEENIMGPGEHSHTGMYMFHVKPEAKYIETLALVEKGVKWSSMGNSMIYGYSSEEHVTTIRLVNIDPDSMDINDILGELGKYGKVLTHHVPYILNYKIISSELIVKMKLSEGAILPPVLYNSKDQEVLKIFWDGSDRICHNCHCTGHTISWCKEKTSVLETHSGPGQSTWAAVAASKARAGNRKAKAQTRLNKPPPILLSNNFPDLPAPGIKPKQKSGPSNLEKSATPTQNRFAILSEEVDSEDIIPGTQQEPVKQRPALNRTKSLETESMGLPCNQAGLLTPTPVEASQAPTPAAPLQDSLNLQYNSELESQSLLQTPASEKIDEFSSPPASFSSFQDSQSNSQDNVPLLKLRETGGNKDLANLVGMNEQPDPGDNRKRDFPESTESSPIQNKQLRYVGENNNSSGEFSDDDIDHDNLMRAGPGFE